MNFYVVTFDRQPNVSYATFHDRFVKDPQIRRWSHYIKSSYIVGTDLSASELSKHYVATAKAFGLRTTHLVMQVNMKERQGQLPKEAWAWFRKNESA